MDTPVFNKLIKDLCHVAGYNKQNVLTGANMPAIHERYFLYRYLKEEKQIPLLQSRWPGLQFEPQYLQLRRRISPRLENKYKAAKKLFDSI